MSTPTKIALKILAGASLLGVLANELLWASSWGLNIALWVTALAGVILVLSPFRKETLAGGGGWLLAPVVLFPLGFAWRDSFILKMLDFFALVIALSLMMLRAQGRKIRYAGLLDYALGSFISCADAIFSPLVLLFHDVDWAELRSHRGTRPALAIGRGVLLSLPPVLIFGGLFVNADPIFKNIVENILCINFADLVFHTLLAGLVAWAACGFLRGLLLGREATWVASHTLPRPSLGITETSIILALTDVLFLAFVIVQLRYFFGGSGLVQTTLGLTYAQYARQGFFELVAVAALVLPLLLLLHWFSKNEHPSDVRTFRLLAGAQIGLLFVIMASAVQRMRLYQQEYGMTELRLYTTAFMGWLAVVFVWFAVTVLRGNRKPFAFGALVAGYLLIGGLHALNPDALIAQINVARARRGLPLDASYIGQLSADAVPPLVQAFPDLKPPFLSSEDRCKLSARILDNWTPPQEFDWRGWSVGRAQAYRAVRQGGSALRAARCPNQAEMK